MFANRFTAFCDACVLAGALKRNLLLSLAEADFFRLRWSGRVLDETETAITQILSKKGVEDASIRAGRSRAGMTTAFPDAMVTNFEPYMCIGGLPDPNDVHVLAASIKTRAHVIVTDNLKHFPKDYLEQFNLEARSSDAFIADTIALDVGKAVMSIRVMRDRLKNPAVDACELLVKMEAAELFATADMLRSHVGSI